MSKLPACLLLGCLSCGIALSAPPAKPEPAQDATKRQALEDSAKRHLLTLNVNQLEKLQTDLYFSTFQAMYAYRELLLWAHDLPADSAQRRDLIAMARDGLEAAVWHSGMGVPLERWSGEGQPVGVLFARGIPHYVEQPDFTRPASLRWNPKFFDPRIAPETLGLSLAVKSLYVKTVGQAGADPLGTVLLASALNEFDTLLALMNGNGDKKTGFMPALLKWSSNRWEAVDDRSTAYGQFSLLLGLTHLHDLLAGKDAGRAADRRKEVRQALERVFAATVGNHFDPQARSFVAGHPRQKGLGDRLGADDAGLAMEALALLAETLPTGDALRTSVVSHLDAEATFVAAAIDGQALAPRAFAVGKSAAVAGLFPRLSDQLSLVNGLLAAEKVTGNATYGKAAVALFEATRKQFWSEKAGIFRATPTQPAAGYGGQDLGLSLATWRRLERRSPGSEARKHGDHLISSIVKKAGLLVAESPTGGEPRQPEDFLKNDLPKLIDEVLPLDAKAQNERIAAAVRAFADQDGDGVPGCRFGGPGFGAAPVIIAQTSIAAPLDAPAAPAASDAAPPQKPATPTRSTP